LHRLGDHACGVFGQRAWILPVRIPVHRPGQPYIERLAELLESRRREREQARAVVRALERDDSGLPRCEQRRAQCDLDGIRTGDAELRGPRQATA